MADAATATVTALPTEDAKIVRRQVYDAIEAVYDDQRKCYKVGLKGYHTDETLAKSLKCSPSLVAKIREEFFGPGEPDEPTEEIKAFQTELSHLEKEMEDCEKLIEGLKVQMSDFRQRIDHQRKKLKAMCEANGWYH